MTPSLRSLPLAAILAVVTTSTASCGESPEQLKLLKTFADEFVTITPGTGQFP
jgi:hypothetical protein